MRQSTILICGLYSLITAFMLGFMNVDYSPINVLIFLVTCAIFACASYVCEKIIN